MFLLKIIITILLFNVQNSKELFLNDKCLHERLNEDGLCLYLVDCASAVQELKENGIHPQNCGFDVNKVMVCCPQKKVKEDNEILNRAEVNRTEQMYHFGKKKCLEYSNKLRSVIITENIFRIVGGTNATEGEFPHMAALGYGEETDIHWDCGGALINEYFVITAAHCIHSSRHGKVKFVELGNITLLRNLQNNQIHKIYNVKEVHIHSNYTPPETYNDIALLELDKLVEFTPYIKPACIFHELKNDNIHKFIIEATGWGLTDFGGSQSDVLQKVKLEFFNDTKCMSTYRTVSTRRLPNGIIESQFCAGSHAENKDACAGDSGGPLQFYNISSGLYCVIGITSFGKTCGIAGIPGVYTKVSYYLPWIVETAWKDHIIE